MSRALQHRLHDTAKKARNDAAAFKEYSRRLLRDLEGKGITRTAVETVNLVANLHANDALAAECIRTFPTVTFPATLLLRREEI